MMLLSENKLKILLALVMMVLTILSLFAYVNQKNEMFKVTEYTISSTKCVKDLRILLVTDLHLKEYGKNNEILLDKMRELKPDLIAAVGDLMIHREKNYDKAIYFLNESAKIAPTYFSSGNHEWTAIHHFKNYSLLEDLEDCDAVFLNNAMKEVTVGNNKLIVCGVYDEPDAEFGFTNKVFPRLNDEKNDEKFKLLLSHCPMTIANSETTPKADLVLSGHEHGGQVIIPFTNKGLYSKNQGFFPKYTNGINTIADNTVIISTGLSNSYHWIPRVNNQPELVVINVN